MADVADMPDPLAVLRDYKRGVILVDFAPDLREVSEAEWDAALAQVEALVEAAHASYPPNCENESCLHASCSLSRALAPFPRKEQA